MLPDRYVPPGPPPTARKVYATPEEAEAARQDRADLEAHFRERREQKAAERAEKRDERARAEGFEDAEAAAEPIRKVAAAYSRKYRRRS